MMIHCACLFPSSATSFFVVSFLTCGLMLRFAGCFVTCLNKKKDLQGVALCGYKMPLFMSYCLLNAAPLISVNHYFISLMFVVKDCTILVNPVGI